MAVFNTDYKKDHVYVGLGDYEISFEFDVETSVVVLWTDTNGVEYSKVNGVDYSIVSVGANSYVRVLIDFGTGGVLTALRDMPLTQTYTWVDGTDPAPSAIMQAIDRIVWMIQQVNGAIVNALKAPATESLDMTIPSIAARALGFLAFDASGLPIAAAGTPTVPVSTYVTSGLTVANATAWYGYFSIDDLVAITDAADDDIMHLQNNAGVDKKIAVSNFRETRETQFYTENHTATGTDTIRTKVFTFSASVIAVVDVQIWGMRRAVTTEYAAPVLWDCTISGATVTVSIRLGTANTAVYDYSFFITAIV